MKDLIFTTTLLLTIALSPLAFAQATHPSENTPGKTGAPDSSGPGMSSGSTNGTSSTAPEKQNSATGTDASKGANK